LLSSPAADFAVLAIFALLGMAQAGFFSQGDHKRVSGLLKSNVRDLQSAYYAAIGLKALGADIPSVRAVFRLCINDTSPVRLRLCPKGQRRRPD
jgi:hypothetical protein